MDLIQLKRLHRTKVYAVVDKGPAPMPRKAYAVGKIRDVEAWAEGFTDGLASRDRRLEPKYLVADDVLPEGDET